MTLNGAIMQLVEMRENSMMPVAFKPYFDKVIETISECVEPSEIPQWIPCRERLPELDEDGYSEKVLTSYENFIGIDICEYRIIDGTGKWYEGDTEESPEDIGLIVNAWMPLPKPYREEQE